MPTPDTYRPEPFRARVPVKTISLKRDLAVSAGTLATSIGALAATGGLGSPAGTLTAAGSFLAAAAATHLTKQDGRTLLDEGLTRYRWRHDQHTTHQPVTEIDGSMLRILGARSIVLPLTTGGAHLTDTAALETLHAQLADYLTWSASAAPVGARLTLTLLARTAPFTPDTFTRWHTPRANPDTHPLLAASLRGLLTDLADVTRRTTAYAVITLENATNRAATILPAAADQLHSAGITTTGPLASRELKTLLPEEAIPAPDWASTPQGLTAVAEATRWPVRAVGAGMLLPLMDAPNGFDRATAVTFRTLTPTGTGRAMQRTETISNAFKARNDDKGTTEKVAHAGQRKILHIVRNDLENSHLLTDVTLTTAITAPTEEALTEAKGTTETDAAAAGLALTWTRYRHHRTRLAASIAAGLEKAH